MIYASTDFCCLKCASIRSHAFWSFAMDLQKQMRTRCLGGSSLTYSALTYVTVTDMSRSQMYVRKLHSGSVRMSSYSQQ